VGDVSVSVAVAVPLHSLLSTRFVVTFVVVVITVDGAGTFDVTFAITLAVSFDFFDMLLLLDDECEVGMFEDSLFSERLESLRSLRADEKPLLELVRFDNCDLGHSLFVDLSFPENIFSLPSIDCFAGV
jgi:hypothetical protein